jgi:hypothetical protein
MSKRHAVGFVFAGVLLVIILGGIASGCSSGDEVKLTVESCDIVAQGEVENTTDHTLHVFVNVEFVDRKGATIDTDVALIDWLQAGETRAWSAYYGGVRDYDTCHAKVGLAMEPARPTTTTVDLAGTP